MAMYVKAVAYTEWSCSILMICLNISRDAAGWKAGWCTDVIAPFKRVGGTSLTTSWPAWKTRLK